MPESSSGPHTTHKQTKKQTKLDLTFGGHPQVCQHDGERIGLHSQHVGVDLLVVQPIGCVDHPRTVVHHKLPCGQQTTNRQPERENTL